MDRWVIGQNAELPASSRSPGPLGRLGKLPSSRPRVTTVAPGPLGLSGQSTDLSSRGLNHWALGRVTELESPDLGTPLPNDKGRRIAPGGRRVSRNVGGKGNVGSARGLGRGTVCSPEFLRDDRGGRRRLYRISGSAAGARCRACGPKGPQGEATDGVWKCPSSGPPSTQRGADGSSTFTKSPLPMPTGQGEHSTNFGGTRRLPADKPIGRQASLLSESVDTVVAGPLDFANSSGLPARIRSVAPKCLCLQQTREIRPQSPNRPRD